MNSSYRQKGSNDDIEMCFNRMKKNSYRNWHNDALMSCLEGIHLLKGNALTDERIDLQDKLQKYYQLYCYHANELGKYELTVKLVKDNYLEEAFLFFDWGFFYCEALLHLGKYDEYEKTKSKLQSLIMGRDEYSLKEVLLTIDGKKCYLLKKYNEAIFLYEKAATNPEYTKQNRVFFYNYALAYYKLKKYDKVIELVDIVIKTDNSYYNGHILKLKTLMKMQNKKKLISFLDTIKAFFNDDNFMHIYLYLLTIYAYVKYDAFNHIESNKQMYAKARVLLLKKEYINNISIALLNKAYLLYFELHAYMNGYNKNDLIVYPRKKLSTSPHSDVYIGSLKHEHVAVKKYNIDTQLSKTNPNKLNMHLTNIFIQISTLYSITLHSSEHSHVLPFKCCFLLNSKHFLYIISPFLNGDSLYKLIHEHIFMKMKTKLNIIYQIAKALRSLHLNGIRHLNVNAKNVMVIGNDSGYCRAMLTGFTRVNKERLEEGELDEYAAPELFEKEGKAGFEADVYSFGILMCAVLIGVVPFEGVGKEEMKRRKKEGYMLSFEELKGCHERVVAIIMDCLEVEKEKRVKMEELVEVLEEMCKGV